MSYVVEGRIEQSLSSQPGLIQATSHYRFLETLPAPPCRGYNQSIGISNTAQLNYDFIVEIMLEVSVV